MINIALPGVEKQQQQRLHLQQQPGQNNDLQVCNLTLYGNLNDHFWKIISKFYQVLSDFKDDLFQDLSALITAAN